eukprot:TRINITY_DN27110_c0_g1_i1.p1 TRINITY_DN27110_c0_g1~~TRINITY_DN27110_c0_g1_i1.p1  ORF type:complete len:718 (+),score=146.11 TRINITY_DN27110_c0_g1_i1:254-2155(+)
MCDLNVDPWTEIAVDLNLFWDRQTPGLPMKHPVTSVRAIMGAQCWEYDIITPTATGTETATLGTQSMTLVQTATDSITQTISPVQVDATTATGTETVPVEGVPTPTFALQEVMATATQQSATKTEVVPTPTTTPVIAAPDSLLPTSVTDNQRVVSGTVGVGLMVSGLLSGSAGSTPALGKMALLMQLDCNSYIQGGNQGDPLPWELHPIGRPIGTHRGSYEVGAMVYNTTIILTFLCLLLLCALIVKRVKGLGSYREAMAQVRCPCLVYIPIMFLMQGIAFAAPKLLLRPEKLPFLSVALAGTFIIILIGGPILLYFTLLRARHFKAYNQIDLEVVNGTGFMGKLKRVLLGDKAWFSAEESPDFVQLYGVVFDSNRDGMQAWCIFDAYHIIFIGMATAMKPSAVVTCHARNFALVAAMLLYFVVVAVYHPFSARFDNIATSIISLLMLVAVLLMSIGIASPSDPIFSGAAYFFVASTYVLLVKAVYDIAAYTMTFTCSSPKRLEAVDFDAELLEDTNDFSSFSHPLLRCSDHLDDGRNDKGNSSINTAEHLETETDTDGLAAADNVVPVRRVHTLSLPDASFRLRSAQNTSPIFALPLSTGSFVLQRPTMPTQDHPASSPALSVATIMTHADL